jgi:O-antigen/teichoic acid export membrane protein
LSNITDSFLARNILFNFIGKGYSAIINVLVLPFYLSYLSAEAFGVIGFFTVLLGWLTLLEVGLSSIMLRESAKLGKVIELKKILRTVEFFFLGLAILIVFLVSRGSEWLANDWLQVESLNLDQVIYSIEIMSVLISLKLISSMYKGVISGHEDQVWLNIHTILINTFKFLGGLLVIIYVSSDLSIYFEYQLIIGMFELVWIFLRAYKFVPRTNYWVRPTYNAIKNSIPFGLSILYTSALWVIFIQIDKLILSHILSLEKFGYYTLVVVIVNGIGVMISSPIGDAVKPRMVKLINENKVDEMIRLYRGSTKSTSILSFSICGIFATFPEQLIYAWSGNLTAAKWSSSILTWYIMGSAMLMLSYFQFFLQFAYGKLRHHVQGATFFGILQILVMSISAYEYGAIGASIAWFFIQFITLFFWSAYIHGKFLPGLHSKWILKDVLQVMIVNITAYLLLANQNILWASYDRKETILMVFLIFIFVISANLLIFNKTIKFTLRKVRSND